jgi:capsular exopolysaccharide synthesis family protein
VQLLSSVRLAQLVLTDTQSSLTADGIANRITAKGDPNTVLLTATVTDTDPARSLDITESIATQFIALVSTLETPPGSSSPLVSLEVTSPPALNTEPVAPKPLVTMGLALIIGLALGVAMALLRELLDKTFRNVDSLRTATKAVVLGTIAFDDTAKASPLILDSHARSVRAEAFRQLRTNLLYVDVDNPLKLIAVTSSVAGEGKSSTATNLAVSFAEAGSKVLLIEGDLRRPRVAEYLGIEGGIGLTNVLTGKLSIADVLQPWGKGGLTVLASGPIPPNPAELLGSKSMAQLLQSLKKTFEIIIIDTPPLLPVTDGAIISAEADGAILVVRHGKTTRNQVARATASLDAVDARILGAVMNMTPTRGADSYGYGYGYYGTASGERPQLADEDSAPVEVSPESAPVKVKVPS